MARILCVDDEPGVLLAMQEVLEEAGHEVVAVRNAEAALKVLERGGIELIVTDYRLPGVSGLELLDHVIEDGSDIPVVMATGYASIDHAVRAMKAGAVDYITKPVRPDQLEIVVQHALDLARLKRQNDTLKHEVSRLRAGRHAVGDSPAFRRVLDAVATAAPTRASVLLQGESGTGKELIARMLHDLSGRGDEPFVSVNCAAMPEHLVESILFGHEKGAFTGATSRTLGAFERAHRGTLLLDEISEMRLDLQAKLLRVLQEQEFERVGGGVPVRVDVRVVSTTNRDLRQEVDAQRFRADLFYRLNVLPIHVPPLRERVEDLPTLVSHFAARVATDLGKPTPAFPEAVLERLRRHRWPGNIRELAHVVERSVIFAHDGRVSADALVLEGAEDRGGPSAGFTSVGTAGPDAVFLETLDLRAAEAVLIQAALERTDQNRTQAAKLLGVTARTLRNKLNGPKD